MTKKETGTKSFVLRVDAETMDAIEAWAADEFRSINRHSADIFLSWKPHIILEDNGVCHNTHVLDNNHSCKKG